TPSYTVPHHAVPCGAARDGEFQGFVLEHTNAGRSGPPTRDDFHQSRRDRRGIEHAAVQQDCIGTPGRNVRLKKRRQLACNGWVTGVRESEFLKRPPCCASRRIGWIAARKKPVKYDAFALFTRDLGGPRTADQTAAFGNHRQMVTV